MSLAGFEQPKKIMIRPTVKHTGSSSKNKHVGSVIANNLSRSASKSPTSPQKKPTGKRIAKSSQPLPKGMYTSNGYQEFKSYKE